MGRIYGILPQDSQAFTAVIITMNSIEVNHYKGLPPYHFLLTFTQQGECAHLAVSQVWVLTLSKVKGLA